MTEEMPPIGRPQDNTAAIRLFAVAFLICAVGAGLYAVRRHGQPVQAPAAMAPLPPPPPAAPPTPPKSPLDEAGLRKVHVVMNGPLETALVRELGRGQGARLSQVIVRALAWWVDVPGDLRKGDKLDVVYEERPNEEPVVHALRFESGKLAQTFRAYRYKAPDSRFAHFYQPGGEEVEKRLVNGPLDDYEQITSLLRDGRGHKGVDFKTPVGTQVKAPFDGVITRRNWNVKMNGDSVELRETGAQGTPRVAMFLHLSEIPATIQPGLQVARGRVIAQSGNTGHSFAPHLHYQLEGGGVVLDPFQSHATERRTLPDADKPAFSVEMKRLDALFDGNAPASGSAAVGAAPPAGSTPPAGSAHAIGGTGAGSGT